MGVLKPLQKAQGLRQRTYEILRSQIGQGKIRPGQRLVETSVAVELGISRTPVREALALLAREGLLVPTTRGFVLPEVTAADVAEIYQLRRLLEPAAFADAVAYATAQGIADMRRALGDQRRAHAKGDANAFALANARFRQAWLSMVPNRRLVAAVALYNDHVQVLRIRLGVASVRAFVIKGVARLVRAIEEGNRAAAFSAMAKHVAGAEVEAQILARDQRKAKGGTPIAQYSRAA
jgi:DNA-binding GntR family transcriptional regulator